MRLNLSFRRGATLNTNLELGHYFITGTDMKIFNKRPLSLILCIMLGGFLFFYGRSTSFKTVALCLCAVALIVLGVIWSIRSKIDWLPLLCCVATVLSVLFSDVYYDSFNRYRQYTERCTVVGTVVEKTTQTFYNTYELDVESVNGENGFIMPSVVLSGDSEMFAGVNVGTKLSLSAKIDLFFDENGTDSSYYLSRGICGRLDAIENIKIISHGNKGVSIFFSELRELLTKHAIFVSDSHSGGLLSALLLGERSALDGKLSLDFKRIGITHVLALSGMHLAILCFGINMLLNAVGSGKKAKSVLIICFTVAYMILTGMSVSVTRAGFMLLISTILYLLSSTHDSFTSLTVSVFIIVLFTPNAAFDLSLWLSAFATVGVIFFSEYESSVEKSGSIIIRVFRKCVSPFLVSLFAIGCTYVITAISFDTVSVLSPISTIIFSPLIQIYLYLGIFVLLFGGLFPIGKLLKVLRDVIAFISSIMSDADYSVFSTSFPVVKMLLLSVFIGFVAFLVLDIKRKRIFVCVLSLLFLTSLGIGVAVSVDNVERDGIIYSELDTGDAILIKSNGNVFIADISSYSSGSGYECYSFINQNGITELDGYYVSHYASALPDAVDRILRYTKVDRFYLPLPQNKSEIEVSLRVEEIAYGFGADVDYYLVGGTIKIGNYRLEPRYTSVMGGGTRKSAFRIITESEQISYLSSGMLEDKGKAVAQAEIEQSNVLLLGSHGKAYANEHYIEFESERLRMISINSDNVFFTPRSLEYYDGNNCEIRKGEKTVTVIKR